MEERIRVARIAPHLWEEPCISGSNGSGTVFFVGCALNCVYCQNHEISRPAGPVGTSLTIDKLADEMLRLQDELHVHNINLVTGTPFIPQIVKALEKAKEIALKTPYENWGDDFSTVQMDILTYSRRLKPWDS